MLLLDPRPRTRRPPEPPRREHAVVVGASMAGLLAARVLSDHFARVTVLDRDALPVGTRLRRGVPQARHAHAFLPSGTQVVEALFPGLVDELVTGGAPQVSDLSQAHCEFLGHTVTRTPHGSEHAALQSDRTRLEQVVRDRLRVLPGVTLRDGVDVGALVHDAGRNTVRGVEVATADGTEEVLADLVVDASGRSARALAWLEQIGSPRPEEEVLEVGLTYTSQHVRLPHDTAMPTLVIVGPRPGRTYGMALFRYEDDTWVWTVITMAQRTIATTREAMLAVTREVLPADLADLLAASEPVTDPVRFRYPGSRRRRYERLREFPRGLLVLGDALCSFNPIYGQGMSVAAKEVAELDRVLATGDDRDLARRFFRRAARQVDAAWELATGSDLALPEIEAPRSWRVRMANGYVERVLRACETDPEVAAAFYEVTWLLSPASSLLRPRVVTRVLRARAQQPA